VTVDFPRIVNIFSKIMLTIRGKAVTISRLIKQAVFGLTPGQSLKGQHCCGAPFGVLFLLRKCFMALRLFVVPNPTIHQQEVLSYQQRKSSDQ